jgi:chromosome segregation ATPase
MSDSYSVDLSSVTSAIRSLESEIEGLRRSVGALSGTVEDLRDSIYSLSRDVGQLSEQVATLAKRQDALDSRLTSLGKTVEGLEGSLSRKIDAASERIADRLDVFEESVEGVKKEVQRGNKTLQDVRGRAEETFKLLDALSNLVTGLEEELRSGLEDIRKALNTLHEKSEDLSRSLEKSEETIQMYINRKSSEEMGIITKGFGELMDRLKLLNASLDDSSKRSLEKLDSVRGELAGRLEKLLSETDTLYEEIRELVALLEDSRLELINLLDSLGSSVDTIKENVNLKLIEVA